MLISLKCRYPVIQLDNHEMLVRLLLAARMDAFLQGKKVVGLPCCEAVHPLLGQQLHLRTPFGVLDKDPVDARLQVWNEDVNRHHALLHISGDSCREHHHGILFLGITRTGVILVRFSRNTFQERPRQSPTRPAPVTSSRTEG